MISLFNLCINLIETFMTCYFAVHYLAMKKRYKTLYFIILWLVVFLEVTIANITESSFLIDTGLPIVTIMGFLLIFSENSLIAKIVVPIFTYIILDICNLGTLSLFNIVTLKTVEQLMESNLFTVAVICSKILFLIVIMFILKYKSEKQSELDDSWVAFVPTCVMIAVIVTNLVEVLFTGEVNYTLLYISLFSLLGFSIFLYFLFLRIQRESEERTRQLLEIQQLRYQKENMEDIRSMNEEIHKIKHDMKHKSEYISECLTNHNEDEIHKILEITYHELDKISVVQFSKNESLNYILQSKNKIAYQNNINFRCEVSYDGTGIENNDFIVLLGNLLDNAIENSEQRDLVTLEMKEIKGYLKVIITNSVHKEVNTRVTSKKDVKNHGYGLKNVKEIVRKYDGEIAQEIIDNKFNSTVILKLKS